MVTVRSPPDMPTVPTMEEGNLLSAYKLINHNLVQSNVKLKSDYRLAEQRLNELSDALLCTRQENKTLRDMVCKLHEQLHLVTRLMVSVRDQSDSVLQTVNRVHVQAEQAEREREPKAQAVFERQRAENPPYVDEAAILEQADEDASMADYRTSERGGDGSDGECDGRAHSLSSCSPRLSRMLKRKSRNRSFDESLESIEVERVFKVGRTSGDRGCHDRNNESSDVVAGNSLVTETSDGRGGSNGRLQPVSSCGSLEIDIDATDTIAADIVLSLSSFQEQKENTDSNTNASFANAVCSTPVAKGRRKTPVAKSGTKQPYVSIQKLTVDNLQRHCGRIDVKQETIGSDCSSMCSNESQRPRRRAAPKTLKEPKLNEKMRRN